MRVDSDHNSNSIQVHRLNSEVALPKRAHPDDAGLDLTCIEDILVNPGEGKVAKTGIAVALPARHVGLVADRSSLAKRGIKTAGGVIDSGYRGEIHIVLWNISKDPVQLRRGERIAQLLVIPVVTGEVVEVSQLDSTTRGANGFGSSGR